MKEKVILRREYNTFRECWGYMACFPEDEANLGCIGAVAFYFIDDMVIFEAYSEISLDYMYTLKIVHKHESDIKKCIQELNKHYDTEFVAYERISKKVKIFA